MRRRDFLKAGGTGNQRAVCYYALNVQPDYGMVKEYRAVNPGQ